MIVGSGMIASAFCSQYKDSDNICIYAAGVSNSNCCNLGEFERERLRLMEALNNYTHVDSFVYFSTCSIVDPEAKNSDYVRHKIEMEKLVSRHPNYFIARLSQVAGKTSNPHTLLNYIYARVSRSEHFIIWKNAVRYIIDVDDVVLIMEQFLSDSGLRCKTSNITNPVRQSISNIVKAMQDVTGKKAITSEIDRGGVYDIDTPEIVSVISKTGIIFDNNYLSRVLDKYYA